MVGTDDSVIPRDYEIKPLNTGLRKHVKELDTVLRNDHRLKADPKRLEFYDVIAERKWYYVRVNGSTIYLVWRAVSNPSDKSTPHISATSEVSIENTKLRSAKMSSAANVKERSRQSRQRSSSTSAAIGFC